MGFIDDTNEHIIGTSKGTMKCGAIRRFDSTDQFDAMAINEMRGTPWEPIPGRSTIKRPTSIEESGEIVDENGDFDGHAEELKPKKYFNQQSTKVKMKVQCPNPKNLNPVCWANLAI